VFTEPWKRKYIRAGWGGLIVQVCLERTKSKTSTQLLSRGRKLAQMRIQVGVGGFQMRGREKVKCKHSEKSAH
jgi:hypothetical protein